MKEIKEMASVIAIDYERRRKHFKTIERKNKIVLLGDSMVAFLSLSRFGLKDAVENLGIAGDTTTGVLKRIEDLDSLMPVRVIVNVGSNDLVLTDHTVEKIVQNLHDIRDCLESKGIPVSIVSMTPVSSHLPFSNMDYIRNRTNRALQAINERLRQSLPDASYVDVFSKLSDADGNLREAYTTDGIHLNDVGYSVYLSALKLI